MWLATLKHICSEQGAGGRVKRGIGSYFDLHAFDITRESVYTLDLPLPTRLDNSFDDDVTSRLPTLSSDQV